MPEPKPQPRSLETPNTRASDAFLDFVQLRLKNKKARLEDLADQYRSSTEAVPTLHLSRLKIWSAKYGWMGRIDGATTELADQMLQDAADLDADTSLKVARETNRRAEWANALKLDELFRMRESVRKPMPKSGASVNVNVSVEVRHLAEQMAKSLGISPEELIAEANEIAATEWEKVS